MAEQGNSDNLSYSQLNATDDYHELCCTRCAKKRKNKPSVKYCTVCGEYFCQKCLEKHDSYQAMKVHPMVDNISDGLSTRTAVDKLLAVPTEFCPHHPMKLIDMYCETDNVVGCSVCFNLEHKSCKDIKYIPKLVQETNPQQRIDDVRKNLSKAVKSMHQIEINSENIETDFEKSKANCKNEIDQYRKETNDVIDKIEERTHAELETKYHNYKQSIVEQKMTIQKNISDLKRHESELLSEQVNLAQKFVLSVMGQTLIKQSEEIKSKSTENQTSTLKFTRNADILAFLLSILTLGILGSSKNQNVTKIALRDKQTRQPTSITTTASTKTTTSTTTTATTTTFGATGSNIGTGRVRAVKQQSKKQGLYKIVNKSEYNMEQSDDINTCMLWSSCFTNIDNIVLVDTINYKIKLVNSKTYNIISSLLFDASPLSVCSVSSTEVVVCLDNNTIQFVSTCNNLVVTRPLCMKHECKCITVSRDRMYICDGTSLYIYNMNGTLIKTIKEIKSGDRIFSNIWDITISDDHKMIHIVDYDKGVITLDMNSKICWEFSGEVLNGAQGLCTDGSGNVIVCGFKSHNVIMLGHNGDYKGEIVTKQYDVRCPLTICFDVTKNKLCVGCRIDDNITVFTLE